MATSGGPPLWPRPLAWLALHARESDRGPRCRIALQIGRLQPSTAALATLSSPKH